MNNPNSKPGTGRWKPLLIILICILIVLGIVYMKRSNGETHQNSPIGSGNAGGAVAVPDTTLDPTTMPETEDSTAGTFVPDTILGTDTRVPYEAGYEDGYETGCDDGANGTEKASYDESSNFHTPKQRENYASGYREGYAKGFEDGKAGKQFNI